MSSGLATPPVRLGDCESTSVRLPDPEAPEGRRGSRLVRSCRLLTQSIHGQVPRERRVTPRLRVCASRRRFSERQYTCHRGTDHPRCTGSNNDAPNRIDQGVRACPAYPLQGASSVIAAGRWSSGCQLARDSYRYARGDRPTSRRNAMLNALSDLYPSLKASSPMAQSVVFSESFASDILHWIA